MPDHLPVLSVRLLGTPEVCKADTGQVLAMSRPAMTLLARLLQRRGAILSRTELADALWPNLDDLTARDNNLRQHLTALRRVLDELLLEEGRRGNQTVTLALPGLQVDIDQFEDALTTGRWQDAVGLYRGELLPGVALPWVEEWRGSLRRKLRDALFALANSAAQRSNPEAAQQYLVRIRELDPFNEEALRQQMALLAEEKQAHTALSLYERYVEFLRHELPGQSPHVETQQLFHALRQKGSEVAGRRAVGNQHSREKSAPSQVSVNHHYLTRSTQRSLVPTPLLPASLTTLIGRVSLCRDILRSLQTTRLVSVVGTGGIGKTRLALEVGRQREAEGANVCLVEFARVPAEKDVSGTRYPTPDHLEQAIAEALNLPDVPTASRRQHLQEYFRTSEILLLWDNCEHIRESARELARVLLTTCPRLRILVTSREPLGLASERIIRVPPLTVPSATDAESLQHSESGLLFLERIGQDTDILTRQEISDIVALCQRLEGIPLALELAASALVRFGTPGALVADLNEFLHQSGEMLDEQGRRRSLWETIAWSDHLLTPEERRLFYRMGLLVGGGSREAVIALAESAQGMHWQQELVYKSLAVAESDAYGLRIRLLEPVREYALSRLADSKDWETATRCHAQWFADWVTARNREVRQVGQAEWLRRLNHERPNIETAIPAFLSLGDPERAAELVLLLWRFWQTRGWWQEGARLFEQVLEVVVSGQWSVVGGGGAGIWGSGGREVGMRSGDISPKLTEDTYSISTILSLADYQFPVPNILTSGPRTPDPRPPTSNFHLLPTLLLHSGMLLGNGPDGVATEKRLWECIALCRGMGDEDAETREIHGQALNALGMQALRRGDVAKASAYYEAALPLWTNGRAALNTNLGINALERGEYAESIARFEAALAIRQELKETIGEASVWNCLGAAHLECGNLDKGRYACLQSLERFEALEDWMSAALARINLGEIALLSNNLSEASTYLDRARKDLQTAGDAEALAECLIRCAEVSIGLSNLLETRTYLGESFYLCQQNGLSKTILRLLETTTLLAVQEGELQRAIEYLGEAEKRRAVQNARRSALQEQRIVALWDTIQAEPKEAATRQESETILTDIEFYLTTINK